MLTTLGGYGIKSEWREQQQAYATRLRKWNRRIKSLSRRNAAAGLPATRHPAEDGIQPIRRGGSLAAGPFRPPERRTVMLQVVHAKQGGPQASSLYCQWIYVQREGSKHLVAVWIDSAMTAFEKELATPSVVDPVTGKQRSLRETAKREKSEAGQESWDTREASDGELQQSEDGLVASRLHIEGRPTQS